MIFIITACKVLQISLDETQQFQEGPIKMIDPEQVPKEPQSLLEGFEWVTMDLTSDKEVNHIHLVHASAS